MLRRLSFLVIVTVLSIAVPAVATAQLAANWIVPAAGHTAGVGGTPISRSTTRNRGNFRSSCNSWKPDESTTSFQPSTW